MGLKNFLSKYQFLILILAIMFFSIIFPKPGQYVKDIGLSSVLTFIAMFFSGLSLSFENIKSSLKEIKTIVFSIVITFFIFPLVAYLLYGLVLAGNSDYFVGVMIMATQASTVSSAIILTMSAEGNVPLAIIITVINNFISIFICPIVLNIVLSIEKNISFNILEMILNLSLVVVVPIILAQLAIYFLKDKVRYLNRIRKPAANFVILMFVMIGSSTASPQLMGRLNSVLLIILFAFVLHIAVVLIGFLYAILSHLKNEDVSALVFCSAEKTMTSSILIWNNYFSSYLMAPILFVFYHMIQIVIDSMIAGKLAKLTKGMRFCNCIKLLKRR